MSYYVETSGTVFQRQLKQLRKRYPRIESDLARAYEEIIEKPHTACHARLIPGLAVSVKVYKYRIRNSDASRGRSGGYRIIAIVADDNKMVVPVAVYCKSDQEIIESREIAEFVKAAWSALNTVATTTSGPVE